MARLRRAIPAVKGDDWTQHDGGQRPRTGGRKILARIRCRERADVEAFQAPQLASWWKNWSHSGGPGDIIEWRYA